MDISTAPLVVHSLTEASLYLALVPCGACGAPVMPQMGEEGADDAGALIVPVVCHACSHADIVRFDLRLVDAQERAGGMAALVVSAEAGAALPISSWEAPSRIIDVAGWLTLYTRLSDAALRRADTSAFHPDGKLTRQLQIQAGRCLEEALKFYDVDNDLPPQAAFYSDAGRRQFREHPEGFLRDRLLSLRAILPTSR